MRCKLNLFRIIKSDNAKVQFGNLGASILGLITFMLLTRGLTKEEFGQWAIFMAAVGLVDLLRSGLGRQAMVRKISADDSKSHNEIIGSALMIQLVVGALITLIIFLVSTILKERVVEYNIFLKWYPLLLSASLLQDFDAWIAQSKKNFGTMVLMRVAVNLAFITFVLIGLFTSFDLEMYVIGWVVSNLLISVISQFHTGSLKTLKAYRIANVRSLLAYGKHSLASMVGVNLLRSSDSLIIGALMGPHAVATYAIPLKIIDVLEIPVRGFATISFSKLSRFFDQGKNTQFISHFIKSTSLLMILFVPVGLVLFIFPELPILFLGGSKYLEGTILIQIFVLAMVLIPLDKYLGVSFDSINQPGRNALKVWLMVIANIIGDIAAIQLVGELWAVAAITVLNISIGVAFALFTHPILKNLHKHYYAALIDWSRRLISFKVHHRA